MRTQDIVFKINCNQELNGEDRAFIKEMWGSSSTLKDEKHDLGRCPKCNAVILYKMGHYCHQCGKKIVWHWQ
mgnify:FL=1